MKKGNNGEKSKRKSIFQIALLIIFFVAVIASFVILWKDSQPSKKMYELPVVTIGDIENNTIVAGKISPRDVVSIKPQISGIISELKKNTGSYVRSGEVIAVVKVIPESVSLNSAKARLQTAKVEYDFQKGEYNRQRKLYENKVIAKEEMDKTEAEYEKSRIEYHNSQDNLDIVTSGVSSSVAGYTNTQIKSTINGTILNIPVKVGTSVIQSNTFNDGTTIARVADMNDMIFIGDLDETEIDRVYVGMPLKISVGALEKRKFDAELEYIAPQGEERNGTILFEIKATVNIPDSIVIRAGYSANAEIVLDEVKGVPVIPERAVVKEENETYVYILDKALSTGGKNHFIKQPVKLGLSDGVNVEVRSGLTGGETIRGSEIFVEN